MGLKVHYHAIGIVYSFLFWYLELMGLYSFSVLIRLELSVSGVNMLLSDLQPTKTERRKAPQTRDLWAESKDASIRIP
jgi:hypothetical protein